MLDLVDERRLLDLERATIRIESHSFQEHALADYYATYMADLGLDVTMMDVPHPMEPERTSRQPVGWLRGSGNGPTLVFNGHMDTVEVMSGWTVDPYGAKFEDGWIWGVGSHDCKGGLAAALCAVEAIIRSGVNRRGHVVVCPVVGHKFGGIGTRALLARGVRGDYCINVEHSTNTIATACVGVVQLRITARNTSLFFRYSAAAKAAYFNSIEQQAEIIRRFGPSIEPATHGTWLTYTLHPDLPGFPMHRFDTISRGGLLGQPDRECSLVLQVRTVPGQTIEQIRADATRVLERFRAEQPNVDYELEVPAGGPEDVMYFEPAEVAKDHPLVLALAEGFQLSSKREAVVGGGLRVGNVGDGNLTAAAGVPTVQFGPGDIRLYPEWPAPDERVELRELMEASRAMTGAIYRLCV
jgi:acetylornithine deacetylase/succinyl-diaminopimelate desuccinylase-like protein